MKKGDCVMFESENHWFVLILHHSNHEEAPVKHGFVIVGESFKNEPTIKQIQCSKLLGFKYQNDSSDLINSLTRPLQRDDFEILRNRVKYDLITIPDSFFQKEQERVNVIGQVEFHKDFFPRPNFHSRQSDIDGICELVKTRIANTDSKKVKWGAIYAAWDIREVLG